MKATLLLLLIAFVQVLLGCNTYPTNVVKEDPDPVFNKAAHFNQANTAFLASHANCLLSYWYNGNYQSGPPIALLVINDQAAYESLFGCSPTTSLPSIDFSTRTLLVGMKADNGRYVNSPVNITRIEQNLIQNSDDTFVLQVKVTGKQSPSGLGGEWFAFTSVAPKLINRVNLDMQYQFK